MEDRSKQPLLVNSDNDDQPTEIVPFPNHSRALLSTNSFLQAFVVGSEDDIPPISGLTDFISAFKDESKKLWYLAAPAILTMLFQYSLGAITQTFAGHVGTIDLAAFTMENNVIAGFCLGVMMGMGSALETLCGQAYGAGQIEMLGVYMQRSWIILLSTGFLLMFFYIFAEPLLLAIGQTPEISSAAGKISMWMIPQLYAYAMNFPIAKFLQAQSDILVMAWISAAVLVLHVVLSWLFMLKLGWGVGGGAAVLNASWWLLVGGQLVYIFRGGCGKSWSGFSWKAFQNLWGFLRLSIASAVMMCLEVWYYTILVLFAGYLKNAEVAVDALSVCTNIVGWTIMAAFGFNAAISVRVSNELGACHPRKAKFSVIVVVVMSTLVALGIAAILLIFQKQYPSLFTNSSEVKEAIYTLTPLLAFCIVLNNVQPSISGVAIGAGWQALVAYVNVGSYYIVGVPLGLIMGYVLKLGVLGIWSGMATGTVVQTLILVWIVYWTDWEKEASVAALRVKQWGGETINKEDVEN